MNRRNIDMLNGPLFPNIIRYTIPIILTSVFQLLFHAADLVIVGQFCGSLSVAAVGSTFYLTTFLVNFFTGLSVGVGVCVAQGLGRRSESEVQNAVHTAVPLALLCGVVLTIIGTVFSGTLLRMMSTPDSVLSQATLYMQIYFGGITFNMLYNFCASILRAAGDTKSPLIYLTFSGILNVLLNLIFVTIFHLDVAGVAIATTISQCVSAILVLRTLMLRKDACRFMWKNMRFHGAQLGKILKIGLPAGIQSTLFSISNVLSQSAVNSFGDVFISGNSAANNLEGFTFVCVNAFQQTAVNFIGQNAGADQYKRIKKVLWICLLSSTIIGLAVGVGFNVFGTTLLSFYVPDSPEAISYGLIRLSIVVLPYFIHGLMDVATGALRGLGHSFLPMAISVFGVCVLRVGWLLTVFQIPEYHTPYVLYASYPMSWIITFCLQMVAFFLVFRKITAAAKQDATT